jgi:hypothetical protein
MTDKELSAQITDLQLIIEIEEENYKTALQTQLPLDGLKTMRENIKKLKADLQLLIEKQSVDKTGQLPEGGVS